ncbi:MAG: sensor histidine kinase [Lachnospiraceae bacterium]|nr:sensor histidine kinase [Lachnospiraceae bacterium]
MNRLYEKLAILLLCLPGFLLAGTVAVPVLAFLFAVIVSSTVQLFSGRKAVWVLLFAASALCGAVPILACALPLFLYDSIREKKWWLVLPGISVVASIGALSLPQILCILTGLTVTLMLVLRMTSLEDSVGRLTELHDSITEKNVQLAEQNKRLFEAQDSEVRVATLKERNRIAREIHDNVGHLLTRSILQTGAIQILNKDPSLQEPLNELKTTLDGAMTSIRESVHDLHDDSIDLKRVLQEMADAVTGENGADGSPASRFVISLQYDASPNIPGDIKLCVAGIVKEGISNAVRHSNGDEIDIIFREHPGFYQLLIEDNGKNKEQTEFSGGIGLRNMEDRAKNVGGRISFTASAQGFRVFLTIPKQA